MSCGSCGTTYTLFKKERGCKSCGYSFCSNCLNKKAIIPKLGDNAKHSVCVKCYILLTGGVSSKPQSNEHLFPPKALEKRMEAAAPQKKINTGNVPQHQPNKPTSREIDQRLAEKLEKLKANNKPVNVPTVENMEERLARLKGFDPAVLTKRSPVVVYKSKASSSTDQVNDLLRQAREEAYLDAVSSRRQNSLSSQLTPDDPVTNDLNKMEEDEESLLATGVHPTITDAEGKEATANNMDLKNLNKMVLDATREKKTEVQNQLTELEKDKDEVNSKLANFNEVNKLFEEVAKEANEEAQRNLNELQKDKELQKKLLQLKKNQDWSDKRKSNRTEEEAEQDDISDEDNEKQLVDKVLNQLLEESAIDEEVGREKRSSRVKKRDNKENETAGAAAKVQNTKQRGSSSEDEDTDELPYCCICVENAKLRCIDCERDLYCQNCFRKCHDELEISHHETIPYKFPTSWKGP